MKVLGTECAYTGGGIWISMSQTTYNGKDVVVVVDNEDLNCFYICENPGVVWEGCNDIYQYGELNNVALFPSDVRDAYKAAVAILIERVF